MDKIPFDNSYITSQPHTAHYPEERLYSGPYYSNFKVTIDRKIYVYKKCNQPSHFTPEADGLLREFEVGQSIVHPNIQRYLGISQDANGPVIIKEFIPGKTLAELQLNKDCEFSGPEILHIAKQLIAAIEYLHKSGITHGDVKPANVIIHQYSGDAYLIDFGHAVSPQRAPTHGGTEGFLLEKNALDFPKRVQSDVFALVKTLLCFSEPLGAKTRDKLELISKEMKAGQEVSLQQVAILLKIAPQRRKRFIWVTVGLFVFLTVGLILNHRLHNSPQPTETARKTPESQRTETTASTKNIAPAPAPDPFRPTKKANARSKDSIAVAAIGARFLKPLRDSLAKKTHMGRWEFYQLRNTLILQNYEEWSQHSALRDSLFDIYQYTPDTWYQYGYWKAFQKSSELIPANE